jgi:hypothetical protein
MRLGRQRAPGDVAALLILLVGFSGLALAFWIYTANWLGVLLPLGFIVGAYATLRTEVREIEVRGDTLLVRTFFRTYPIPRAHIRGVVRVPGGAAIDVLNGNRYDVTPPGVEGAAVAAVLDEWLRAAPRP